MENTYFRAIGLLVLALMCGMAAAQYDTGVEIEADEFTGEVSCRHTVFVSSGVPQGVSLHRSEGRTLVFIVRREVNYEPAFNMFGLVGGELIYVRWPDGTVDQYEPIAAEFSSDRDMEIGVIADHQLALKLMASPDNVRVRFDGPNRNADFTIAHDVVVALAQGFGQECLE